ncbi:MAG: glycoside hydrolase family 88 protein [Bacteroidetes bacterium]|nr:glycoside hydrolase family 88 protein [Bacteroidota bacterium]
MNFSGLSNILILVVLLLSFSANGQKSLKTNIFNDLPGEADPVAIGTKLTERFLQRPHSNTGSWYTKEQQKKEDLFNYPLKQIVYPDVCTWYGALTFSEVSGQSNLCNRLTKRTELVLGDESYLVPKANHVDNSVFGTIPLEVYTLNKNKQLLDLGLNMANEQFKKLASEEYIKLKSDEKRWYNLGLSWQTRMWIDDMYMITILQSQAYKATGDTIYINRAAREMVAYLDELQKPNGLFHHADNVPIYWGRGNGWMAAGMTELLLALPENQKNRSHIMEGFQKMMATLLNNQDSDGMWHQIIDDPKAYKETSCTGMFAFAFITGVKKGWLDANIYAPAARKAWIALCSYINKDGDVTNICEGTNKENNYQYYLNRQKRTGDLHGQAPVLWCATALLKK